jgi:hypothetical protein
VPARPIARTGLTSVELVLSLDDAAAGTER